VYHNDGSFHNEWTKECDSWRKAWKIAKDSGANKDDCTKMFDDFLIIRTGII
jgi:hypothetical protein